MDVGVARRPAAATITNPELKRISTMHTLTQTTRLPLAVTFANLGRRIGQGLNFIAPLADLAVRLWVANAFFRSGLVKIQSWESTIALFTYEYSVSAGGSLEINSTC
jgi:hypothetical protein